MTWHHNKGETERERKGENNIWKKGNAPLQARVECEAGCLVQSTALAGPKSERANREMASRCPRPGKHMTYPLSVCLTHQIPGKVSERAVASVPASEVLGYKVPHTSRPLTYS